MLSTAWVSLYQRIVGSGWLSGLLLGLLTRLGFAPYGWWWLLWPLLAVLVNTVLYSPSRARAGLSLAAWWLALFVSSTHWLSNSLTCYGGLPVLLSYCVILGLGVLLSVPAWLSGELIWSIKSRVGRWWLYGVWWPLTIMISEWVVSYLGECAWLQLAYTQVDGPFGGLAAIVGANGLGLLVVQCSALLGCIIDHAACRARNACSVWVHEVGVYGAYLLLLILFASWGYRQSFITLGDSYIPVRLVQLATTPEVKWNPNEQRVVMERYWKVSDLTSMDGGLLVWPEAAITEVDIWNGAKWQQLSDTLINFNVTLLTGCVVLRPDGAENSLVAIGMGSGIYSKRRLLPFGEYFPMRHTSLGQWLAQWIPFNDLRAGDYQQKMLAIQGGVRIATVICSEIAYSELLASQISSACLIVTVADDSWFGLDGMAGEQHLAIARMRSIEYGRYQIWANNSGPSAIIDHRGRLVSQAPKGIAKVIYGVVYPAYGATIYSRLYNFWSNILSNFTYNKASGE